MIYRKRENVKKTFDILSSTSVDNKNSYYTAYKSIINEYIGYTLSELLVLCKIDRLYERKLINLETHDYLYRLIDLKHKLRLDLAYDYRNIDNEQDRLKRINEIDMELEKYGLNYESINDFIDSTIDANIYNKEACEKLQLKQ